ncbi:MAG: hypothetical protein FWC22_06875 [Treponema sp.]|nr:hypothetical protein [Treponema sp.]
MTKKGFSFIVLKVIITVLVFGVLSVAPVTAQTYTTGKEFYPAVYGMITELYPNSRCTDIDFYNNTYTFTGITGYSLPTLISYDLKIQLINGKIELTYDKIYERDSNTKRWIRRNGFGFYNWNNASKTMTDKMITISSNEVLYEKYQKAAMGDIFFVHTVMRRFTELAFKDFVDNYAKGSIFNVTGQVNDVTENKNPVNGESYKYQVSLSFNTANQSDSYLASYASNVRCYFYTNDDRVIRLSKSTEHAINGILVGARQSSGSLSLTIVDAN